MRCDDADLSLLPQSSLPEVSEPRPGAGGWPLKPRTYSRCRTSISSSPCPPALHPLFLCRRPGGLSGALCRGHGDGERGGQITSRRDTGSHRRPSHLDADAPLSPARALHRDRRRAEPRSRTMDRYTAQLLPARPSALQGLPGQAPRAIRGGGHIAIPVHARDLRAPAPTQAASTPWVVYSKAPMAGPDQVLRYLSRYSHRVAIGNERIVAFHDGNVTFRYRDRRRGNRSRLLTVPATEFVQRFLLHTLPSRFVRIRHYGLLANGQRTRSSPGRVQYSDNRPRRSPSSPPPTPGRRSTSDSPDVTRNCARSATSAASELVYALDPAPAPSPRGP